MTNGTVASDALASFRDPPTLEALYKEAVKQQPICVGHCTIRSQPAATVEGYLQQRHDKQ